MKKVFFFVITLFSFLLISCIKHENTSNSSKTYAIDENFDSIIIEWEYGNISFIHSPNETKIVESSTYFNVNEVNLDYNIIDSNLKISSKNSKNLINSSDLIIYYDFSKNLKDLIITGTSLFVSIDKQKINNVSIKSETITSKINESHFQSFYISGISDSIEIKNSEINDANLEIPAKNITIEGNIFTNIAINSYNCFIIFDKNEFENLEMNNDKGNEKIWLNGNVGFEMSLECRSFSFDFETINYNSKYFYLNGESKIKINSPFGDVEIKRYFA